MQSFHTGFFSQFEIPLPPLDVQKEIVAEIEGYQKVIDGTRAVITRMEKKIQSTLARVWGEEEETTESSVVEA